MHDTIERRETVITGTNELIEIDPAGLKAALDHRLALRWKKGTIPEQGDRCREERIAELLDRPLER